MCRFHVIFDNEKRYVATRDSLINPFASIFTTNIQLAAFGTSSIFLDTAWYKQKLAEIRVYFCPIV